MKKNKLTMSIAAGVAGVAGLASVANAVHINPEGTGQVLIYPYYSVHNTLQTTYSIVNTTADSKAVKIRFLEGENSLEVLDFNIYMSAYDVWAGVLGNTDTGPAHGRSDTTCAPFIDAVTPLRPFLIEQLDGVAREVALERALDGHFEVLEMGTLNPADAALVDHGTNGVPADCQTIADRWTSSGAWTTGSIDPQLDAPTGGLFGGATILEPSQGAAMSYNAVALDDFWGPSLLAIHTDPGSLSPSLVDADATSNRFQGAAYDASGVYVGGGNTLTSTWLRGIDAVSALFMSDRVMNEYVYDEGRNAKTEWVVTFPTKNFYVNGGVTAPFSTQWSPATKACEGYNMTVWDREELPGSDESCYDISPQDPNAPGCAPVICYEANVVEFLRPGVSSTGSSALLGSQNLVSVSGPSTAATPSGWARMGFNGINMQLVSDTGASYRGLPVTGFMVQRYSNAAAAEGLLASYAATFTHNTRINSF